MPLLTQFLSVVALAGLTLAAERHGTVKFGGLPVPGATVTAIEGDKKFTTVTNQDGVYTFADLAEGAWNIEVEMLCFAPSKQRLTLAADGSIPDVELKLLPMEEIKAAAGPVAAAAPAVTLAAAAPAPPVEPAPAPTPSAKPGKKGKVAPQAANTPGGFQRADVNASKSDAAAQSNANAAAGSDLSGNDDLNKKAADGLLINGTSNNAANSPFALSPAFGNSRPGLRSLYNGSLGFSLDTSAFDARPYSITGQDTPKPDTSNFKGLGQFGGPIRIPHLISNGPFFFVAYQWTRNRTAQTTSGLMPTQAQRAGDFSSLPTPILDPATGVPFPGNMIPPNRIAAEALNLLKLYPLPNFSGSSLYNYQQPLVTEQHQDSMQTRLNKSINRKNQVYGGYGFQSTRTATPTLFDFLDTTDTLGQQVTVNWRHAFTNRFWTTLGLTYSRQGVRVIPNFAYKENISGNAGVMGNNQEPQNWGPPALNFSSGIYPLSDANHLSTHSQSTAFSDDNYWNHGRHNLQFGGDYKRQSTNVLGQTNPRGSFQFNGAAAGNDFAGFMLGIPDQSNIAYGNADKYLRGSIYEAYLQDDMRVSPSLTVNAGVRWEYWTPLTELYGRLVNLDVVPGFPAVAPVVANQPVGSLTGMRYPDSLIHPDKHAFQPRIGISWRPFAASSMVVRAGYGVTYNTSVYQQIAQQMDQQAPLSKSLSVPNTPENPLTLANGFNATPGVTETTFGIDPHFLIGYAQTWRAEVQRDLPGALIVTATYLGIKGTRGAQEFLPNTYPLGATDPCPKCPTGFTYAASNGNSTREAGQIQLRRRMHNGITASVQYVYAKAIDDSALGGRAQGNAVIAQNWLDLAAERGLSSFDQRHQVTFQGQYSTGMGAGGGTLMNGWKGALFKEWTISTNITAGTGQPLTPTYAEAVQGTGVTGSIRPDYTGADVYNAPAGRYLNPAAYVAPASGQWGNAGRDSITGPSQFSMNASLARTFRVSDRMSLDLRIDSTNILNHVTFGSWVTVVNSPQFGAPPSAANPMRTMLTTLRLRF
ncbi:MAG TPA: TonB-dependent receptor [Bryobacteraceae bacterium]|nr:TonB-dependent receptor [Bryobacteraceae bacterium]